MKYATISVHMLSKYNTITFHATQHDCCVHDYMCKRLRGWVVYIFNLPCRHLTTLQQYTLRMSTGSWINNNMYLVLRKFTLRATHLSSQLKLSYSKTFCNAIWQASLIVLARPHRKLLCRDVHLRHYITCKFLMFRLVYKAFIGPFLGKTWS